MSYAALAEVLSHMADGGGPGGRRTGAAPEARCPGRTPSQCRTAYALVGHYEEAIAPCGATSSLPNFLPSHLMLAVVYSQLGQTTEARGGATEGAH